MFSNYLKRVLSLVLLNGFYIYIYIYILILCFVSGLHFVPISHIMVEKIKLT
jgi:hypothetical protein